MTSKCVVLSITRQCGDTSYGKVADNPYVEYSFMFPMMQEA